MKQFLKKPFVYATVFGVTLASLNTYALLRTYLIPSVERAVPQTSSESSLEWIADGTESTDSAGSADNSADTRKPDGTTDGSSGRKRPGGRGSSRKSGSDSSSENQTSENNSSSSEKSSASQSSDSASSAKSTLTSNSYSDGNISVQIKTVQAYDTTIYIADVQLSSAAYLKTALAQNSFGRNVTEKTSAMASSHNAILAINGDYYGANSRGYVIKNGVLYRDTARKDTSYDDLVIYRDGSFGIVNESSVTAQELIDNGAYNLFSFGPTLVQNGKVVVSQNDEVGRAMANNPRTAIGIIDDLHYVMVVSDGRTSESTGLSLYELAQIMQQYGCKTAYNLDGGGSSTMVFNGQVVNNPTTNGNKISERAVSDIVYIGY